MSLFVCVTCGCVDNTALTNYWLRNESSEEPTMLDKPLYGAALCSECDPNIGKWHGRFPKELDDGKRKVLNRA